MGFNVDVYSSRVRVNTQYDCVNATIESAYPQLKYLRAIRPYLDKEISVTAACTNLSVFI